MSFHGLKPRDWKNKLPKQRPKMSTAMRERLAVGEYRANAIIKLAAGLMDHLEKGTTLADVLHLLRPRWPKDDVTCVEQLSETRAKELAKGRE